MAVKYKSKRHKKVCHKKKLKFENYKNCIETTHLENEINYLEKNKIDIDSIKENHKEFVKSNKSIFKIQQRFKSERHNVFVEEIKIIKITKFDDVVKKTT